MKFIWTLLFIASVFIIWFFLKLPGYAHFADRPDLNDWAKTLKSAKGMCCSFADAITINDPDVDMDGGHYRVRLDGQWVDVPDAALVTVPNRYGQAVVWPYKETAQGEWKIRCFMPGAGT